MDFHRGGRQGHSHGGWSRWGSYCAARRRLKPAMRKMWKSERNLMEIWKAHSEIFRESNTTNEKIRKNEKKNRASTPLSPISFLSRRRNLRVVFTFSISANACQKRQSDTQNGKEFSTQTGLKPAMCQMWNLKEIETCKSRASTPLSPIWFSRRSRFLRVVLCCNASAKTCGL